MRNPLRKLLFWRKKPEKAGRTRPPKPAEDIELWVNDGRLSKKLPVNLANFKRAMGDSNDMVQRVFKVGFGAEPQAALVFMEGLADRDLLARFVIIPLTDPPERVARLSADLRQTYELIKERVLWSPELHAEGRQGHAEKEAGALSRPDHLLGHLTSGDSLLLLDGIDEAIVISAPKFKSRSVEEPVGESVVRGAREGFVEVLRTNESMVRRRIGDWRLRVKEFTIGAVTRTKVALLYIDGIADGKVVREARARLGRIQIDGILESGYIQELIQDAPLSPFPTMLRTERPDLVAASLLEGRIAIMTDGTPFVLVAPVSFATFLRASEDYYESYFIGSFLGVMRFVAFFSSILFTSLYIAVTTFHQELLPTSLALSVASQREGIPFPAFVEGLLMELSFEVLREAGVRLPRVIGPAVTIVGALVMGRAAVEAGLVSPFMLIVVAFAAIGSFVTPQVNFAITARLIKYPLIFLAGALGFFGIVVGLAALLIHLTSLRSLGVPYLSPIAPVITADLKDVFYRAPWWSMRTRPKLIGYREPVRTGESQRPDPTRGYGPETDLDRRGKR